MAKGITQVYNPDYIHRGYERLEEKLSSLGADIRLEKTE
jgi:UDP-N-acetylglucosamine enolpyruvyl transferase